MANETSGSELHPAMANGEVKSTPAVSDGQTLIARATRIIAGDIRPEDYLPVTADILDFVTASEARTGIKLLPEYRRILIAELVLQTHHAGEEVLVRYLPDGVIVLAAGPDVDAVWSQLSADEQRIVTFAYPGSTL